MFSKLFVGINSSQKIVPLINEGYGFGFLVSAGKEGETVVQSLIPDGVAWKVSVKSSTSSQEHVYITGQSTNPKPKAEELIKYSRVAFN